METLYRRNDNMVFRNIGGECLLVPIRADAAELDNMYVLNATGAFLWELLERPAAVSQMALALAGQFDVSAEAAAEDAGEFVAAMLEARAIETEG